MRHNQFITPSIEVKYPWTTLHDESIYLEGPTVSPAVSSDCLWFYDHYDDLLAETVQQVSIDYDR